MRKRAVLIFILLLSGCASFVVTHTGSPFARLTKDRFDLGRTTSSEIVAIMGKPQMESRAMINGKNIWVLHYSYSTRTQKDIMYVRVQTFYFYNDILVGQLYSSSFEEDATNFDDGLIKSIQKGKTKIDEVLKKLGPPTGESLYPLTSEEHERKIMYFYPKKTVGAVIYSKEVTILYKTDDTVSEVLFTENGL